ncbi:MAG: hypothetical protein AAF665_02185 [Pseudomonadota bacterium]
MRYGAALLSAVLWLAACAPQFGQGYRDTSVPLGASARFETKDFVGDWVLVAAFDAPRGGQVTFLTENEVLVITSPDLIEIEGRYRVGIPGELLPTSIGQETLVIMWVDEDAEIAAFGVPSGRLGGVLDRDGRVPPDRAEAVRDILDFYGWRTQELKGLGT